MWRRSIWRQSQLSFARLAPHRINGIRWQSVDAASVTSISPALLNRAKSLAAEHSLLSDRLLKNYDASIAKKAGSLSAIAESFKAWEAAKNSLPDLHQLLDDPTTDSELRSLANDELASTARALQSLAQKLKASLIPPHPFADLPCILEIRPGTGGDEASLFASSLLRMYQSYCKAHSHPFTILSLSTAAASSSEERVLEAVLEIPFEGAYELLRCEAGVHRVQRVPATETKGRTHTSTATVLVLPSFPTKGQEDSEKDFDDPESDYYVNSKDVRTDTMRASGAGGQHVNMTDSAVRLTHAPSGIVVSMQTSRSQHKNREDAWRLLRSRLAAKRREEREEEMGRLRSSIGVGKGGRADKVRTYNWGQQRVTDHRSGITLNRLDDVLEGGGSLDEIMGSVREWIKEKELEAMIAEEDADEKGKKGR